MVIFGFLVVVSKIAFSIKNSAQFLYCSYFCPDRFINVNYAHLYLFCSQLLFKWIHPAGSLDVLFSHHPRHSARIYQLSLLKSYSDFRFSQVWFRLFVLRLIHLICVCAFYVICNYCSRPSPRVPLRLDFCFILVLVGRYRTHNLNKSCWNLTFGACCIWD